METGRPSSTASLDCAQSKSPRDAEGPLFSWRRWATRAPSRGREHCATLGRPRSLPSRDAPGVLSARALGTMGNLANKYCGAHGPVFSKLGGFFSQRNAALGNAADVASARHALARHRWRLFALARALPRCAHPARRPHIPNPGADRFYDQFAHSFQAMKVACGPGKRPLLFFNARSQSEVDDYMDILRVLSTQLQYVPPEEETFHLSINGRDLGQALLAIGNALLGDESVAQLSLETAGIDKGTVGILATVLTTNHTLQELYLTGNNLGPAGIGELVTSLKSNSTLVTLHLGSTACGDEGCAHVVDLMTTPQSGVRRFNLSGNGITSMGFAMLEGTKPLSTFCRAWLTGGGADAARSVERIVELELRDNDVSQDMCDNLEELLRIRFKPYMELLRQEERERAMRRSDRSAKGGKVRAAFATGNPRSLCVCVCVRRKKRFCPSRIASSVARATRATLRRLLRRASTAAAATLTRAAKKVEFLLISFFFFASCSLSVSISDFLRTTEPPEASGPSPRRRRQPVGEEGDDDDSSEKAKSAPGSPRASNKKLADLIGGAKRNRGVSVGQAGDEVPGVKASSATSSPSLAAHRLVLHLRIIEAARLKPVQKRGVSDPLCHAGDMVDTRGKRVCTTTQKKTLSPQWNQAFDVPVDDVGEWKFELYLVDGKVSTREIGVAVVPHARMQLGPEKGALGRVVLDSKLWDLGQDKGQEQWVDVLDGLGAVKLGLSGSAFPVFGLFAYSSWCDSARSRPFAVAGHIRQAQGGRTEGARCTAGSERAAQRPPTRTHHAGATQGGAREGGAQRGCAGGPHSAFVVAAKLCGHCGDHWPSRYHGGRGAGAGPAGRRSSSRPVCSVRRSRL